MSMLEFVKRAFAEGGVQMEFLCSLLDCKEVTTDMPLEERFYLTLAEVLRLKTQIQTLQSQVSQMTQERDRMTLLIWTELSRLGQKFNPEGTAICDTPVKSLVEEAAKSLREDSTLRFLLAHSGYASSSSNETPASTNNNASVRPSKRARISLKSDPSRPSGHLDFDSRDEEVIKALKDEALPPTSCIQVASSSVAATSGHICTQSTPEQRILIDAWIAKQLQGEAKHPNIIHDMKGAGPKDWYCHVCCSLAKDGPPGDHFCYGRYENGTRDNLKVFCQYCRKGTARMPDLRVHFRKIVYCRDLRAQLKMALSKELHLQPSEKAAVFTLDTNATTAVSPVLLEVPPVAKESPTETEFDDDPRVEAASEISDRE